MHMLQFRNIGPSNMDGRIDRIAVPLQDPDTIYAGAATGGLWKSINRGTTWKPVFDNESALSIGFVAVAPSNPGIVWVGTGEANNRQSSSWGMGVFKSTDGGETWTNQGLKDSYQISSILIDPTNPAIVYVGVLGNLWGPGGQRGLYKTTDGGANWTRVLYVDGNTGVADLAMNPQNPLTLYAAMYERRRSVFGLLGVGPSSALYKSTDGGATWTKLMKGLPYEHGGNTGRIGISVYPRDPRIVYARVQYGAGGFNGGKGSGIYRSTDGGATWQQRSNQDPRPEYFQQILVDPNNYLRVWLGGGGLGHSNDGGKNWLPNPNEQGLQSIHADVHAIWIDENNSKYMMAGDDGGLDISEDGGVTWVFASAIPVGQPYHVATDDSQPFNICGGFQDNGAWCGPVRTRNPKGILNHDWSDLMDGDGFHVIPDPKDPDVVFVEAQSGKLIRENLKTNEYALIRPLPKMLDATPFRWHWNAPVVVMPDGDVYAGANVVFKSTDAGNTWAQISPDLTTNPSQNSLTIMGEKVRPEGYPCLTAVAVSPVNEQVIWAGAQDGSLHVTKDGGRTWTNVANAAGLPQGQYVSSIAASNFNPGTAYITYDGHRQNDYGIYVLRTDDYGQTWQLITNGVSNDRATAQVIAQDPFNKNLLFLGTEMGFYISFDRGDQWLPFQLNMPHVMVDDVTVQRRTHDLVVAAYGRAFWVLDDIRSLENLGPEVMQAQLHVFPADAGIEWRLFDHRNGSLGDTQFVGSNPPDGGILDVLLSNVPNDDTKVQVNVTNAKGELARQFEVAGHNGINRIVWDLRRPTIEPIPQPQLDAAQSGFYENSVQGPFVEPGTYTLTVSADGVSASQPMVVQNDPSVHIGAAAQSARQQAIAAAYKVYGEIVDEGKEIAALNKALADSKKSYANPPEAIKTMLDAMTKTAGALQKTVVGAGPGGFGGGATPLHSSAMRLLFSLENVSQAPTESQLSNLAQVTSGEQLASAQLKTLESTDLAKLNAAMRQAGMAYVAVTPEKKPEK
ncbi:MAG: WD40/YVTN/BNR-like repeat-containing protein [Terriglobales bacterium]